MCCNSCGVRIVQLGGGGAPFTFNITSGDSPFAGGAGVDSGPIAVNSGDTVHFYSVNTIDFQVLPGSVNVLAESRIDPNLNNIITVSPAGLLVDGSALPSGVNLYNSDGFITDPTRTATIGTSNLVWDANDGTGHTIVTNNAQVFVHGTENMVNGDVQTVGTDMSAASLSSDNVAGDSFARIQAYVSGQPTVYQSVGYGGSFSSFEQQALFFDFAQNGSPYFELRLNGDPGAVGEVLTSNGAGLAPTWTNAGSVSGADNGLSISGSDVILGGTMNQNTNIDMAGNTLRFFDGGGLEVLELKAANNDAWQSRYYDVGIGTTQHTKADRFAFFNNLGSVRHNDSVIRHLVTTVSTSSTLTTAMEYVVADSSGGAITVTLPALASTGASDPRNTDASGGTWGQKIFIKRRGGNLVTISAQAGELVDNALTTTLVNHEGITLIAESSTRWGIVGRS